MLFVNSSEFLRELVPEAVSKLTSLTNPSWGKMSANEVTRHLILAVRMSCGEFPIEPMFEEQKTKRIKVFLNSDRKLPRDFYNPIVEQSDRIDLGTEDLKKLKKMLHEEIQNFYNFYSEKVDFTTRHPVFGELNFEEWERFHHKHFYHHLLQFGLIDE